MMLAYQPVRALATLNITVQQGLMGSKRILPIIDEKSQNYQERLDLKLTK